MKKAGGIAKSEAGSVGLPAPGAATRAERLRQVGWATLISLAMALAMLLEPLDWALWTNQSRLGDRQPSGDIVYLQIDDAVISARDASARMELAQAVNRLRTAGASEIFLDFVLTRSTAWAADAALARSLGSWGDRATFVDRIDASYDSVGAEVSTDPYFGTGHPRVWQGTSPDWPYSVWSMPYTYRTSSGVKPSFAAALGQARGPAGESFLIGYFIRSRSVATVTMAELTDASGGRLDHLAGKIIVLGAARKSGSAEYHVPGQAAAPPSYVAINAAETLRLKPIVFVSGFLVVLVLALFLAASASIANPNRRRIAYAATVALPLYLFLVSVPAALRIELSYCLPLLGLFAVLRSRSNWKHRVALVDPDTGLPTLRALVRLLQDPAQPGGFVVVAKIHGYESILRSLDGGQRASYVHKLVERLRVAQPKLPVYFEGHYLAWRVDEGDELKLRGHLEGLRAIFAAPVSVTGHSIDVGITFGAARIEQLQRHRSLPSALAAVEETSEALEPVRVAESSTDGDSLWDLSLRARIDAAMEAGEVFCVYQPKMDISADRIIGVEALVRWEDPERGFIPPLHFVMQCEKAGRMEYLTRYVLQSACSAARLLHFRGSRITMSVNISATLLSDMRIVGIVRNVLQATDFDANYLMLEITETARIHDLTQARSVLKALKALGTHLSMDDFGVGAANFEALQALPFDEIKIDRQFVTGATTSSKARAISASIVSLGTSARIAVVAEGAETEADLQMLREIGCWRVQGYALAKPMPLTNLLTFIGTNGGKATSAAV